MSQQTSISQVGSKSWLAGPSSFDINMQTSEKPCFNWCWAACVQGVLDFYGLKVTQTQIIQKLFKNQPCMMPNSISVVTGLTGWAPDTAKKFTGIYSQAAGINDQKIIENLTNSMPLITVINAQPGKRQAYILHSIYYTVDDLGKKNPDKVVLMDPWPGNTQQVVLTWPVYQSKGPEVFKVWVVKK
jgi:hypothetical protein